MEHEEVYRQPLQKRRDTFAFDLTEYVLWRARLACSLFCRCAKKFICEGYVSKDCYTTTRSILIFTDQDIVPQGYQMFLQLCSEFGLLLLYVIVWARG